MENDNSKDMHPVSINWSPWLHLPNGIRKKIKTYWYWLGFSQESGEQLRFELDMLLLRLKQFFSLSYARKKRDYSLQKNLLVHLGCGNAIIKGWVNIDCYPSEDQFNSEVLTLDMRRPFFFRDKSVVAFFSEHFFEHMQVDIVRKVLLPEIYRLLENGGTIRFAVPDGEYFVEQYLALKEGRADTLFLENFSSETGMINLNQIARAVGHKFLYDFETFALFLSEAGFKDVKRKLHNESDYPIYLGLDRQDDWRGKMSLYIEARVNKDD